MSVAPDPHVHNPFSAFTGADVILQSYQVLAQDIAGYLTPDDVAQVLSAAVFAASAHEGQARKSGEPYITHPICVADILAKGRFGVPVLQAALLHDVLEDTPVTKEQLIKKFGVHVADIVHGVSKLTELKHKGPVILQAETFRHLLISSAKDPRVILIKLADRLHNLQTLGAFKGRPDKQKRIWEETMEVYVPIAECLGLFLFRVLMEDLVFSYAKPWRYAVINHHYNMPEVREKKEKAVNEIRTQLEPVFKNLGINASIKTRPRYLSNVYARMKRKGSFAEAMKTHSIRILTDTVDNCYRVLGCLHSRYRPVEGKLKDYIGSPKTNGYRSLHTSIVTESGQVFNVQIRTHSMHALAEMGIVAVWHQKLKNELNKEEQSHSLNVSKDMQDFLSRLKDIKDFTHDPEEFYATVKAEMGAKDIRVFTPHGKPIDLPFGATPIDFAYNINTEIGHHCVGATVNGRKFPITQVLSNGQTVVIHTSKDAHPHPRWVELVATKRAKNAIRAYFRKVSTEQACAMGKKRFEQAATRYVNDPELVQQRLQAYLVEQNIDENTLFSDIGYGKRQSSLLAGTLFSDYPLLPDQAEVFSVQSASGEDNIHLASCCYPLPHEAITGELDGDSIIIHRRDCPSSKNISPQHWVLAEWAEQVHGLFPTQLLIDCTDRRGLLNEMTAAMGNDVDIRNLSIQRNDEAKIAHLTLVLGVADCDALAHVMTQLRAVDGILNITRP